MNKQLWKQNLEALFWSSMLLGLLVVIVWWVSKAVVVRLLCLLVGFMATYLAWDWWNRRKEARENEQQN